MKTPNPVIKSLIEFVDKPALRHSFDAPKPNFSGQYDRYAQKLARRWLLVLAIGETAVIVWLIIRLAK